MTEVDYKQTINLPKTDFPMRANLPAREPAILAKWQSNKLYEAIRAQQKGQEKYIMNDGPPYANGDIHIGHAVNKILKDFVVKSKTLSGKDAPFIPGWDCHGLPIELNVEKTKGKPNIDISPADFRTACREYANTQVSIQRESFKRLGVLADWDRPYLTMDYQYQADIMRSFGKIYEAGHIQSGLKPVHWCTQCGSALAEAEVEYQDKASIALDVGFEISDHATFLKQIGLDNLDSLPKGIQSIGVIIWTTTPWTLPANQAVALNPELDYVLVQAKLPQGKFDAIVVSQGLLESCMTRYDCSKYQVIKTFRGVQAEHTLLRHPFYNRQVPIVLGDHVTLDAGTGAVHTAPAHGMDDYHVGIQYGLPLEGPVDNNGQFYPDTEKLGGLHVFKANDKVAEILSDSNTLIHRATLNHSYPHCWRHKTPLIFRATQQWFISMEANGLRETALKEIKKVKWIPDWGESRITLMIEGRPDWCISRQRTWGVPIPLFVHKTEKTVHPRMPDIIEYVAQMVEKDGIEAWYQLDLASLPFDNIQQYDQSMDTLDVWFDSGVSHFCVMQRRDALKYPAQLFLEGSDQHRGWFQSSLLSAVGMHGKAPYEAVLTHGFTVDHLGRKMSKSLGNVVAPDKVIKTLGADVLRLWVAATDYKGELHVSDEILKRTSDAYRRIRNTARFLLGNIHGFDFNQDAVECDQLLALDQWIVDCAVKLQQEIIEAYDHCQFHAVYQKIHQFCVNELGSFYLDIIKDRQYTLREDSLPRRSAQTAMYHVIQALVRWMAPILSFTAEEIWEYLGHTDSVFLQTWYAGLGEFTSKSELNQEFWAQMLLVRNDVNKAIEVERNKGVLGSGLEAEVVLYAKDALYQNLSKLSDELRFVLITSYATVKNFDAAASDSTAMSGELPDLKIAVRASTHDKCKRCWHRREDVNHDPRYPEICGRCVENIDDGSNGEKRLYA